MFSDGFEPAVRSPVNLSGGVVAPVIIAEVVSRPAPAPVSDFTASLDDLLLLEVGDDEPVPEQPLDADVAALFGEFEALKVGEEVSASAFPASDAMVDSRADDLPGRQPTSDAPAVEARANSSVRASGALQPTSDAHLAFPASDAMVDLPGGQPTSDAPVVEARANSSVRASGALQPTSDAHLAFPASDAMVDLPGRQPTSDALQPTSDAHLAFPASDAMVDLPARQPTNDAPVVEARANSSVRASGALQPTSDAHLAASGESPTRENEVTVESHAAHLPGALQPSDAHQAPLSANDVTVEAHATHLTGGQPIASLSTEQSHVSAAAALPANDMSAVESPRHAPGATQESKPPPAGSSDGLPARDEIIDSTTQLMLDVLASQGPNDAQ